jgi:catechol 2,3-dioxygenase-like lactoylglutathione lyase family enzyme
MQCCQLALSTVDLTRTHWWYRRTLGFAAAGERRERGGPEFAAVPGLPEVALDVWCLVGQQPFMQIEMIQFTRPVMRPRPQSWRRSDIGYSTVGICVPNFDGAINRIHETSGDFVSDPIGTVGHRRICLLDPDSTLIELMEDCPGGVVTAAPERRSFPAVTFVSLSVRDIDQALSFWIDVLGCERVSDTMVHTTDHECLWGLSGAVRETAVVSAGGLLLECVQYSSPRSKNRPAGYMLSDQGILNVALGTTDRAEFDHLYSRAVGLGFKGHVEPWTVPDVATVVYLTDPQGFSVELLHVSPSALARMGFVPNVTMAPDATLTN